ncbi:MAG TPA: protein phosphatase 2C domain-containing protein [Polyangiaceae bacterium]|nr:protein phosphatase 2C domain-containing protein [Polyangiaceae bacterium]
MLKLTGYDLSDGGPGRTVNEDATLVREDLGLFAVADGAGGRGRGDVAANLALRSVENYIGASVRRSHDRPDQDLLGIFEQAKRLSAAVHQAHYNLIEVIRTDPTRAGMASTIVAALMSPRTNQLHIAHVGDSRCYRMRHRRLELLTTDDTIATEILELRPETADEILSRLPRNSVVRALGMEGELRVHVSTHDLLPGDQYLLCTDGLSRYVDEQVLYETLNEGDPVHVVASELLNHALAAHSLDNISVLAVECAEEGLDDAVDTRRYADVDQKRPVVLPARPPENAPSSADLSGPEIVAASVLERLGREVEPQEDFGSDSDFPTQPFERERSPHAAIEPSAHILSLELDDEASEVDPSAPRSDRNGPPSERAPYSVAPEDFEGFEDGSETS